MQTKERYDKQLSLWIGSATSCIKCITPPRNHQSQIFSCTQICQVMYDSHCCTAAPHNPCWLAIYGFHIIFWQRNEAKQACLRWSFLPTAYYLSFSPLLFEQWTPNLNQDNVSAGVLEIECTTQLINSGKYYHTNSCIIWLKHGNIS